MSFTTSSKLKRAGGGTPPAAPTSLSAAVSTTTTRSINLSWTQSSDPAGDPVLGYKIYRGGSLVATVGRTGTYADTGLGYSTSYSYVVKAYNTAGGNSPDSGSASATTYGTCTTTGSSLDGTNASAYGATDYASSSAFSVPNGCFRIRSRALGGGGGGGYTSYSVHLGSCYNGSGGGGGGGYTDETISVAPGQSLVAAAGHGGRSGYPGGKSGIRNNGAPAATFLGSGAPGGGGGGISGAGAGGAGSTASGTSGNYAGSPWSTGGAAASAGTDPTGTGRTHGSSQTNPFSDRCSCSTGQNNTGYGGGGAGGSDCGSLYGEAYMQGGSAGRGYVVWSFSES